MVAAIRRQIRERAGNRCEYCHLPQAAAPLVPFHVEHIIAIQHGGSDEPANLALACFHCNLHKGPNIAGIDPDTGELVALFDPRNQTWTDHFEQFGSSIVGQTTIGRATVAVLAMNADQLRQLRIEAG
jgi:hypothetical protein